MATVVWKVFRSTVSRADIGKMMLVNVHKNMDSCRENIAPETISHLLGCPDHYTDVSFVNIHTTHLLTSVKQLFTGPRASNCTDGQVDTEMAIINSEGRLSLGSLFDYYSNRGPGFAEY